MKAESNKFLPWINFFKLTLYHLLKLLLSKEQKLNLFGIKDFHISCLLSLLLQFFPVKSNPFYKIDKPDT